jgi:hypothetical protein
MPPRSKHDTRNCGHQLTGSQAEDQGQSRVRVAFAGGQDRLAGTAGHAAFVRLRCAGQIWSSGLSLWPMTDLRPASTQAGADERAALAEPVVARAGALFSNSGAGWGVWGHAVLLVSQSGLSAMVAICVPLSLAACSASASSESRLPPLMIQSWKVIIDSSPGRVAAAAWMTARE